MESEHMWEAHMWHQVLASWNKPRMAHVSNKFGKLLPQPQNSETDISFQKSYLHCKDTAYKFSKVKKKCLQRFLQFEITFANKLKTKWQKYKLPVWVPSLDTIPQILNKKKMQSNDNFQIFSYPKDIV